MGYGSYSALSRLSGFLFLGVVVLGINNAETHPTAVFLASLFFLVTGIPACIYGLYTTQKYRDVFDFEPVAFWGKQRNGKSAREVLTALTAIGLWCFISGLALIILP